MKTVAVPVTEQSQVAEARRQSAGLAREAGFDSTGESFVSLVATEAATNLIRHAGGGDLLATHREDGAVEILALDKGPGIADLERSLRDGYSTAGGAGTGLGAIRRLSSEFDVYTAPGRGTALLARMRPPGRPAGPPHAILYGGVAVPLHGEPVCGDSWSLVPVFDGVTVMVADGLGHGYHAAQASAEAERVFRREAHLPAPDLIDHLHASLRATRGAAVALARLLPAAREVRFAGLGNIGGMVYSGGSSKAMISHPGTVGHTTHKARQFTYAWPAGALVLLYSDGINSHLSLEGYPGLAQRDPSLIAGVIFRDFSRQRDDATVVALRERSE